MMRGLAKHGFSLNELLVVVLVLAILLAIGIPVVQSVRKVAQRSVCSTNLRTIGQGVALYETDHDRVPFAGTIAPEAEMEDDPGLAALLRPYLGVAVPTRTRPGDRASPWDAASLWICPSDAGYDLAETPSGTAWRESGSSYSMGPAAIVYFIVLERFPDRSIGSVQRGVTQSLRSRSWPFVLDNGTWHANRTERNALYYPDGRAGVFEGVTSEQVDRLIRETVPFLGDRDNSSRHDAEHH